MMTLLVTAIALWLATTPSPDDERAILAIRAAHDVAYNKHDAKALAELYAPDGDSVSNAGVYAIGRAAIEKRYADLFAGPSKNAKVQTLSTKVRFLTNDVAMLDVESIITGRVGGTVHNHTTSVYVKRERVWQLVAERATRIPEN